MHTWVLHTHIFPRSPYHYARPQKHLGGRFKFGFRPPRTGRRGEVYGEQRVTLWRRFSSLFDPIVTMRTIINEGAEFGAFAL